MSEPAPAHPAAIGLGANLGDRAATIAGAVDHIAGLPGVRLLRRSNVIETPALVPPGGEPQPAYLNAAVLVETTQAPRDLLDALLDIERSLGRTRTPGQRWMSRTLDLDLLLYGDAVIDEPGLTVPHPRLHERRFVLDPLAEIAGELVHPLFERTIAELRSDLLGASPDHP